MTTDIRLKRTEEGQRKSDNAWRGEIKTNHDVSSEG
jgi:hypothetical protein